MPSLSKFVARLAFEGGFEGFMAGHAGLHRGGAVDFELLHGVDITVTFGAGEAMAGVAEDDVVAVAVQAGAGDGRPSAIARVAGAAAFGARKRGLGLGGGRGVACGARQPERGVALVVEGLGGGEGAYGKEKASSSSE